MWLETVKGCKDWKQICYYKCEKGSNLLFCNLSFFFFCISTVAVFHKDPKQSMRGYWWLMCQQLLGNELL